MSYFNIKSNLFTVPQQEVLGEYEKIDEFMENLEKSGVYQIIKSVNQKKNLCKQKQKNPKYDMNYDKVKRRWIKKVGCEIMFECLWANIRRYLNSLDNETETKFKDTYWKVFPTLQSEKFLSVKQKKELLKN